jgi:glycosyltransferase 2 family protein
MRQTNSTTSWQKQLLAVLQYLLMIVIAGTLLFFSFRKVSVESILQGILKADIFYVALSVIFSFIALVVRSYRWRLMMNPLGYKPPIQSVVYSVSIGYLANLAFPRLGEVSRCGTMHSMENIPVAKLLGTVVVERIVDVLSLLACLLILAIFEFDRLGNFLYQSFLAPFIIQWDKFQITSMFLVVILLSLVIVSYLIRWLYLRSSKNGSQRWKIYYEGFVKGIRSVMAIEKVWVFILQSIGIWVLYFLSVYVCLFAFPFTSHFGGKVALLLLVAGGLGMSAPVQGGIGAYHLLVTQGLAIYSINQQDGLTFATLLHSLNMLLVLGLGTTSLVLVFFKKRSAKINIDPVFSKNFGQNINNK